MKFAALAFAAVLACGSAMAQTAAPHPITSAAVKEAAFIAQRGGGATAQIGPLSISSRGFSTLKMAAAATGSPGGLPLVSVSSPVPEDVALEAARVWAVTNMPDYASRVGSWLRSKGVGIGYYSFEQPIQVTAPIGGSRSKKITFIAAIDANGKSMWGNPKIVDDNPIFIDAVYTPKHPANGYPASWGYTGVPGSQYQPQPGRLIWRTVTLSGNPTGPVSEWQTYPGVDGHFDPNTSNDSTEDVTQKVPCLVDKRNTGCNQGLPDIRFLMNQTGASFGKVTVLRPAEPAYQSAGDGSDMPIGTIVITRREATCTTLREWGNMQVQLSLRADQFIVKPATPLYKHEAMTELSSEGMSPVTNYYVDLNWNDAWPYGQDQPHNWRRVMLNPLPSSDDDFLYWLRDEDTSRMALVIQDSPLIEREDIDNCPRNTARDPKVWCDAAETIRGTVNPDGSTTCPTFCNPEQTIIAVPDKDGNLVCPTP